MRVDDFLQVNGAGRYVVPDGDVWRAVTVMAAADYLGEEIGQAVVVRDGETFAVGTRMAPGEDIQVYRVFGVFGDDAHAARKRYAAALMIMADIARDRGL